MAPVINLEYDDNRISTSEAEALSNAVRDIVSNATKIEDVFVYANSARIKIQVSPVEIFVRMTAAKIEDENILMSGIKQRLSEWKASNNFQHPINLTLIPMNWRVEIGI